MTNRLMASLLILTMIAGTAVAGRGAILWLGDDVWFGEMRANSGGVPDFRWDDANKKLKTRSLVLAELGDPVDIALRRTGPDNAPTHHTPVQPLAPGRTTLAILYGQALGENGDFEGRRPDGSTCLGRSNIIAFQADGAQRAASRPGRIAIGTTREGECDPRFAWALEEDGAQNWSGQPTYTGVGQYCAMVRIRFFDGVRERDGYVPLFCGNNVGSGSSGPFDPSAQ